MHEILIGHLLKCRIFCMFEKVLTCPGSMHSMLHSIITENIECNYVNNLYHAQQTL